MNLAGNEVEAQFLLQLSSSWKRLAGQIDRYRSSTNKCPRQVLPLARRKGLTRPVSLSFSRPSRPKQRPQRGLHLRPLEAFRRALGQNVDRSVGLTFGDDITDRLRTKNFRDQSFLQSESIQRPNWNRTEYRNANRLPPMPGLSNEKGAAN